MVSKYGAAPPNLQIRHLYTFRSVYDLGGYAATAAESNLSVPAIWQHIQALEKAYETRLFEKVGRRIKPTAAADQLYAAIDVILVGFESTFGLLDNADGKSDSITLVSGNRMMMEDLSEPLAAFQRETSNRLSIRHGNNKRAEELLIDELADIALSLEPTPDKKSSKIHYEPAYMVDFLAVAPKRHPYAKAATGSLRELVKHPLIVTSPGTHGRDALEQALHRERLTANIVVETDNSGFTIACVQAGMGLGILAGRQNGQLCQKLATRSLRRQLGRREIVFMWRKGRRLTEPMLRLVETIANHHATT